MNYSDTEISGNRTDEEALIEAGLKLLPVIGASLYSAISQLGQAYHLTPAQVKVLLHLGSRGQMTVGEAAAALNISMPAASELVDRLVDAGHLERASDPTDRRRVIIAATPDSRRIGAELRDLRRAQLQHALDQLEPTDRPIFIRSLEALVAGLNCSEGTAAPGCSHSFRSRDSGNVPEHLHLTPRSPLARSSRGND
jgi:DNA-binding MarR family transcriptional regulator